MLQVFNAEGFTFRPPPQISRARRVLIKPDARYPRPHPLTTSAETVERVIAGIRRVSDADIIILEGNPEGKPMTPIYKALGYNFPRVLTLDVKDSIWVEIESPLEKPPALASAWVPNVMLSCDFWINVATMKVVKGKGYFTVRNLLGLLPIAKFRRAELEALGMEQVLADLYFILPFDLGVIDGRKRFEGEAEIESRGRVEDLGKILVGDPLEVDREACRLSGARTDYLELIRSAQAELEV